MPLVGTEVLYVVPVSANGMLSAVAEPTTTLAIAALADATQVPAVVNTAISTAGNGTLSAAGLVGGVITRTGPSGAFSDATDTAVAIVAALAAYVAAESSFVYVRNTTAFAQTITAGAGVTLTGNAIVPANSVGVYLMTITSATAVVLLSIEVVPLAGAAPIASTTLSTVGAGTITAAGIAGGVTNRTGSQSATPFTDTTDTGTNLSAAVPNVRVGQSFIYRYKNTTDAVATIAAGAGVTVSVITTVGANSYAEYLITNTAANTYTMVGLMSAVLDPAGATYIRGALTQSGGAVILNNAAADQDLTVKKLTSGNAAVYDAGADTWTLGGALTQDGGAIFNEAGAAVNFRVESDTNANALLVDGTNNRVGILNASPSVALDVTGAILASTTITGATLAGIGTTQTVKTSGAVTKNANVTYANVTGLSHTVVSGATYKFRCVLPSTVASGTGGIKYCFNYTTTVLTSIESTGIGFTASAAALVHTTTTTTQTDLFTQAAVVLCTIIEGTFVVTTGGTIDVQMAQNTSNASDTVALIGGTFQLQRVA